MGRRLQSPYGLNKIEAILRNPMDNKLKTYNLSMSTFAATFNAKFASKVCEVRHIDAYFSLCHVYIDVI